MNSAERSDFEPQAPRYERIEELNKKSFLMTEGSALQVIQSLHSAGAPRDVLTPELAEKFDQDVVQRAQRIGREILVGNVSPLNGYGPKDLGVEERIVDATKNVHEFLYQHDIDPADVRVLRPERDYSTSLSIVDLDSGTFTADDTGLLRPDKTGDLLYTYNPDIIPAARPADCPVAFLAAETPKGSVTSLLHLAWLGVAHGYVTQAKEIYDAMGVDWSTARVQITPGGHAETFNYTNFKDYNPLEEFPGSSGLFKHVKEKKDSDGNSVYDFDIDSAAEVYEQIIRNWGIDEYQVYLDTSDTTSPTVGYSSNSRAFKGYAVGGENSRDIILGVRTDRRRKDGLTG